MTMVAYINSSSLFIVKLIGTDYVYAYQNYERNNALMNDGEKCHQIWPMDWLQVEKHVK